ncbi:MAG: thiol-disulfide oxidoreductase DCC family protein [Bacteroidota bacterium]
MKANWQQKLKQGKAIILFDGVCNLCNGLVQFVLPRDTQQLFNFAALQSETGAAIQQAYGFDPNNLKTFIILHGDEVLTRSSAALFLLQRLGGLWSLMRICWIVPRPLRDLVYNFVARNRYRWFGREESCMLPQPEWMERFV